MTAGAHDDHGSTENAAQEQGRHSSTFGKELPMLHVGRLRRPAHHTYNQRRLADGKLARLYTMWRRGAGRASSPPVTDRGLRGRSSFPRSAWERNFRRSASRHSAISVVVSRRECRGAATGRSHAERGNEATAVRRVLDQRLEAIEGRVDRGGRLHVDAGVAQQVERILRAAALEEARGSRPAPACRRSATRSRQGDRRRQAGGVLVDVERPVEVRDAEALERQLVVDREVRAEVERRAARGRSLLKRVDRQRLARLGRVRGSASRTRRTSSGG